MSSILEEFVDDLECMGFTFHTIESYKSNVKYFLEFYPDLDADISDLRKFLRHLRARELSNKTISAYFSSISAFYDFLVFEKRVVVNPVLVFRRRYLRKKEQYGGENTRQLISVENMKLLINSTEVPVRTMMLFLAKTGLRRGELIAMDLEDLDLETGEFWIKPKVKRTNRLGFMDPELIAAMKEYLEWRMVILSVCRPAEISAAWEDRNPLWVNSNGKRINRNYVYYSIVEYAGKLGLHDPQGTLNKKLTPHCFRHFFTTHLRRAGMPREFIQELRGDRRKDAIDIYDHIDPEELRLAYLRYIPKLL